MTTTLYRTQEEWKQRWQVAEYHPNKEITGEYDENLAAKCTNGIFGGSTTYVGKFYFFNFVIGFMVYVGYQFSPFSKIFPVAGI